MKSTQSLFTALLLLVVVAACTNEASTNDGSGGAGTGQGMAATETAADATQQNLDANKKLATDFVQSFYGDKDSTAIDKYVSDNFKTHNPLLQDGKETLKTSLRPFLENPNLEKVKIDIKQTSAEGDKVWLLIREVAPNGNVYARVDIFRIENGKIVENWLVSQAEPKEAANTNTMF